jgi:uncharacterized protein YdiU (UPF0061 family)
MENPVYSPLEELQFNNTFHALGEDYFTEVEPQGLKEPYLVSYSPEVFSLLGLPETVISDPQFTEYFSGRRKLPGSRPLAMVYSGHQFGVYNPRLGDGRALLLGELEGPNGRFDLNLKGAGLTPYSRFGDGRAVLRSSIREYLCSEAMAALGIPTTRALCIIGGRDEVLRETVEPSATVVRVSPSHIRFGSFEWLFYQGRHDALKKLADYVIEHHFPECVAEQDGKYLAWFKRVVERTASLIAHWQATGFAHGVMNTDNMSILGETFDYGPFGFLDDFEPGFICNHSDETGRYAFDQQPRIGLWNLNALAYALQPLVPKEQAMEALSRYEEVLVEHYNQLIQQKLGLMTSSDNDGELIRQLLEMLAESRVDYTNFFRALSRYSGDSSELIALVGNAPAVEHWLELYDKRLEAEEAGNTERQKQMKQVNPKYILRNYLAQRAIEQAYQGSFEEVDRLLSLLQSPYEEHPGLEDYARAPKSNEKHLSISCSS